MPVGQSVCHLIVGIDPPRIRADANALPQQIVAMSSRRLRHPIYSPVRSNLNVCALVLAHAGQSRQILRLARKPRKNRANHRNAEHARARHDRQQ
jgi:hypothetical protein